MSFQPPSSSAIAALKAGQLCAGRDVIGARSGGECPIASIIPVRRFKR
jgi:hypothetical protein